jgi:hypothetical protein
MVGRLSLLQLFPAFAVATARNDPPPSSERASGTRLTAEWQTGMETMSGCRQRKLRLSFAPSPLQCEAGQIDSHSKDDGATSCFRSTFKCQRR